MRATLPISITIACFLSAPAIQAQNIPLSLFSQMADNARSAKGTIRFTLAQGATTTRITGTSDIKWTVRPDTSATAEFEYTDGQWKSLRLAFSNWIEASFREGTAQARRQKLTRIVFLNGQPDDYFDDQDSPVGLSLSAFPEVRSHLRVPNGPASLLLATLFAGMETSPSPQGHGLSPAAVNIQPAASAPGVVLVLKPASVLPFSPGAAGQPNSGSWLRLAEPVTVPLAELSFVPIESVIKFHLGAMAIPLADGRLAFGDTVLLPANPSRISFDSLDSDSTNTDVAVSIPVGSFSGRLASGSQLQLTRNAFGATTFAPQPSADSRIGRFTFYTSKNGVATLGGSNMTIPVAGQSAAVVFDHADTLNLTFDTALNPTLSLIAADWTEGRLPIAQGKLSAFRASITGGALALDRSLLRFARGTVASDGLSIGSPNSNAISGSLQQLAFTLDANSVVDAGAGAAFRLKSGAASSQSLVFDSGLDGPTGTLAIADAAVQNGVLRFGDQALFSVSSDKAAFTAVRTPTGTDWNLSGALTVTTGSFLLNTVGSFLVQSGTVAVTTLSMNDSGATGGSFSALDLTIAPQTIAYGNNLSVVALGPSRLRMNQGASVAVDGSGNLSGRLSLWVPIFTGSIRLGSVGTVELKGGNVNFDVTAAADLSARVALDVDVQIASGQLRVVPGSEILLGEGTIIASALAGSPDTGFVGPIAQADLAIRSASFSFNSGLQFTTKAGRFVANTNFKIASDGLSVSGPFSLRTGLNTLRSSANSGLSASGGSLDLELRITDDRSVVTQASPPSFFHGAHVHFQTPNGDSVDLTLDLENARLDAPVNQPATLTSDLRARFNQFDLNIHTQPKEGYTEDNGERHDDARFFSVAMTAALDPAVASAISADGFKLTSGQPVPPLKPTVHLVLTIPPGEGEHPNSSIHEAGNHGGDDNVRNASEAFTDTYHLGPFPCRVHVYLFQGTYKVTAELDLTPVWSGGKVTVSNPSLNPPITRNESTDTQGWDRKGCDGPFAKIVAIGFVTIIGAAIAGPVGGFFVGALGNELINFAEDRLDNWISAQLASRIQSLQFSQ